VRKNIRFNPKKRLLALGGLCLFGIVSLVAGLRGLSNSYAAEPDCYSGSCKDIYVDPSIGITEYVDEGSGDTRYRIYVDEGLYVEIQDSPELWPEKNALRFNYLYSTLDFNIGTTDDYNSFDKSYIAFLKDSSSHLYSSYKFDSATGWFSLYGDSNNSGVIPDGSMLGFVDADETTSVEFTSTSNSGSGYLNWYNLYNGAFNSMSAYGYVDRGFDSTNSGTNSTFVTYIDNSDLKNSLKIDRLEFSINGDSLNDTALDFVLSDKNSDWSVTLDKKDTNGDQLTDTYSIPSNATLPDSKSFKLEPVVNLPTDNDAEVAPGEDGYGQGAEAELVSGETSSVTSNIFLGYSYDVDNHADLNEFLENAVITINRSDIRSDYCYDSATSCNDFYSGEFTYIEKDGADTVDIDIRFPREYKIADGYVIINDIRYPVPVDYSNRESFEKYNQDGLVGFTVRVPKSSHDAYWIILSADEFNDFNGKVSWSEDEEKNSDALVEGADVELVGVNCYISGDEYRYFTAADGNKDPKSCIYHYKDEADNNDLSSVLVPADSELIFRVLPGYTWQAESLAEGVTALEELGTYTYKVKAGEANLGVNTKQFDHRVESETDLIPEGDLEVSEDDIENGIGVLSIKETEPSDETKTGFAELAGKDVKLGYFDFSLSNILDKGNGESWVVKDLSEPSEAVEVTLYVKKGLIDEDVKLFHAKHDGTFEEIPVVFDAEANSISFVADGFSDFALTVNEIKEESENAGDTPNTLDDIAKYIVVFGAALLFGGVALKIKK